MIAKTRFILSQSHRKAASTFSKKAKSIEEKFQEGEEIDRIKHRAYVVASVIATGNFLEAVINQLLDDVIEDRQRVGELDDSKREFAAKLLDDHIEDYEYFNCLKKYQLFLFLYDREEFNPGEDPYQAADHVYWLRNFLAHGKAKFYRAPTINPQEDLENKGRYIYDQIEEENPLAGAGNPDFPDKSLGHGVTKWCLTSALNFTDEFFSRIDLEPRYERSNMDF